MRTVKQKDKQTGFTLVEIILSLGLTALLLGLLSSGVYIVAGDWNRNSDVLDKSLDQALAVLQIDRALHGAFPHSYTNFDTLAREIYFHGEDDYLSFVSAVSPQRSPGLTVWEMYSVADEGVYLSLVPAFSDNPTERLSESEPILVLENYTAEFSYLYQDLNENRLWIDEWFGEEELSLPLAVYVRFIPERDYEDMNEELEIVARIKNNQHRSIRPTTNNGL
ncbi:MAG: prepilin-type N-terminal cleavage/methylation domain-containing protein [Gammaproteobacteria bacterium]|jgi:general secretion pathway protein J|nr:prepilin-type N-terminal cleavage/methylation domain-containing protein [Gammaproteobacteria bacterium]